MFILKVIKKGQEDQIYTLDSEINIVGRFKNNLISLDASYGVSREHLKITPVDSDSWKVECVSHLGGLIFNKKEVSECIIKENDSFSLQDYIFTLHKEKEETKQETSSQSIDRPSGSELSLSQSFQPNEDGDQEPDLPFATNSAQSPVFSSEDKEGSQFTESPTVMSDHLKDHLKPYLVISLSEDEEDKVIDISDKETWIVGREPSSDICIEDINISRHHFKIIKKDSDFFIEDLESSNGTSINGKLIKPKVPQTLNSGDIISILNIEMFFEIRNVNFEKKRKASLPAVVSPQPSLESPQQDSEQASHVPAIIPNAVLGETLMTQAPGKKSSTKRILLILSTFLIIGGGAFFFNSEKEKDSSELSDFTGTGTFESLTDEEKENVKNLYILSQQQYQMKKFELCNQTLEQLHNLVPFYQESQELITTCKNGAESVQIQLEIENQKKQEEQERKKLREIVSECKGRFKSFQTLEELEGCLSEAITIDPEDEELNVLRLDFETQQTTQRQRQEQLQKMRNWVAKETKIYNQAKKIKDDDQLLKAIDAYKNFLLRDHPSSLHPLVQTARKELFEMEQTVQTQIDSFMNSCKELMVSKKYKQAYQRCQDVFIVSPKNKTAQQTIHKVVAELEEKFKPIFNESVINESLGQVEIAKKQWNLIIEQDIPNGKYSRKAQKKLSKY